MPEVLIEPAAQATSNYTTLDGVVSNVPWADEFVIGAGVNAMTGSVSSTALKPLKLDLAQSKTSRLRQLLIQNKSDYQREIEASASGKYNIGGLDLSASAEYLRSVKYSELSISLVAQYESTYRDYDLAATYDFTDHAREVLNGGYAKFRDLFGDYFVAGVRRQSLFTAVFTCSAQSSDEMTKFKASIGASAPNVFEAKGSVSFMQSAQTNNVTVSIETFMHGYDGTPPDLPQSAGGVLEQLKWFRSHELGVKSMAYLRHYSAVEPEAPKTLPIDPKDFTAVQGVYSNFHVLSSQYQSLPSFYRDKYRNEYEDIRSGLKAYQETLASDATRRGEFADRLAKLLAAFGVVFDRQEFYFRVRNAATTEPGHGAAIEDSETGPGSWMYGYQAYPKSAAVEIQSVDMNYHEEWHVGWREQTLHFGPDQTKLIVGWRVISNWTKGLGGQWKKVSAAILLRSEAAVWVCSCYDRGCNWTVRIFYVNAADYQFEEPLRAAAASVGAPAPPGPEAIEAATEPQPAAAVEKAPEDEEPIQG